MWHKTDVNNCLFSFLLLWPRKEKGSYKRVRTTSQCSTFLFIIYRKSDPITAAESPEIRYTYFTTAQDTNFGVPCVISNQLWFSELPWKIILLLWSNKNTSQKNGPWQEDICNFQKKKIEASLAKHRAVCNLQYMHESNLVKVVGPRIISCKMLQISKINSAIRETCAVVLYA